MSKSRTESDPGETPAISIQSREATTLNPGAGATAETPSTVGVSPAEGVLVGMRPSLIIARERTSPLNGSVTASMGRVSRKSTVCVFSSMSSVVVSATLRSRVDGSSCDLSVALRIRWVHLLYPPGMLVLPWRTPLI